LSQQASLAVPHKNHGSGGLASTVNEITAKLATHAAIEQGDDGSIGALLDGPLMLTGMSAIERELLASRWAKERLLVDVKRLEELKKASVHLSRGAQILLTYSFALSDQATVVRARKSAEAAARAMAGAA
jgi:hypothetical protein